jgi:hypothetical protein
MDFFCLVDEVEPQSKDLVGIPNRLTWHVESSSLDKSGESTRIKNDPLSQQCFSVIETRSFGCARIGRFG